MLEQYFSIYLRTVVNIWESLSMPKQQLWKFNLKFCIWKIPISLNFCFQIPKMFFSLTYKEVKKNLDKNVNKETNENFAGNIKNEEKRDKTKE